MSFLKKLFGFSDTKNKLFSVTDDKTLAFEKNDTAETMPVKFMLMVLTEVSGESPKFDDVNGVIESSYPEYPKSEALRLMMQIMAMHTIAGTSSEKWKSIYENFISQLKHLNYDNQQNVLRNFASGCFFLKMEAGMVKVAETYVYRMSLIDGFITISKQEYIQILEEEKENSGYNEYKKLF